MLGKLIKYEFKGTAKIFVPTYLALLLFTIVGKAFLSIKPLQEVLNGKVNGIFWFTYVLIVISVLFLTFLISLQRFYKNLLGDEGYLMHTLPTTATNHIWAKLLTATTWYLTSGILVVASVAVLSMNKEAWEALPELVRRLFQAINDYAGAEGYLLILEFLIAAFAQLMLNILFFYAAMALGQMFGRHKILGSIVSYIGLNVIIQTVMTVMLVAVSAIDSEVM
ncbi:MAG: hypothetical protein RR977_04710 [Oscillospiraceae bacterium]